MTVNFPSRGRSIYYESSEGKNYKRVSAMFSLVLNANEADGSMLGFFKPLLLLSFSSASIVFLL